MTQEEIRQYLGKHPLVFVQIANAEDGSPEIAWGDTFFYICNAEGEHGKMPFATLVTKDYPGFDSESHLDRKGVYRLNMEVGKEKFETRFGFKPHELENNRSSFDFTSVNQLFPHPLYGSQGWVSMINPETQSETKALLDFALERAMRRGGV